MNGRWPWYSFCLPMQLVRLCSLSLVNVCRLRTMDEVAKIPCLPDIMGTMSLLTTLTFHRHTNKTLSPQISVDMFIIIWDQPKNGKITCNKWPWGKLGGTMSSYPHTCTPSHIHSHVTPLQMHTLTHTHPHQSFQHQVTVFRMFWHKVLKVGACQFDL